MLAKLFFFSILYSIAQKYNILQKINMEIDNTALITGQQTLYAQENW